MTVFEQQHIRTPQDCPVCWQLVGGPKLYPGEQVEYHPVIISLHWDELDREGEDGWPVSRQLRVEQRDGNRDDDYRQRDES